MQCSKTLVPLIDSIAYQIGSAVVFKPIKLERVKLSAEKEAFQAIMLFKRIVCAPSSVTIYHASDCMDEFKFVPRSTVIGRNLYVVPP